jgi:ribosomal protein S3
MAGAEEAGVAAGSEVMTVQARRTEEIGDLIGRRIGQAAGGSAVKVSGDLDRIEIEIEATRPGVVRGHGGAQAGRLRAELEELTGRPVVLNMVLGHGWPGTPD